MIKITALIITANEAKNIGDCIDSVRTVADEVLVIDSYSSDETKAIAIAKGASVLSQEFIGFGKQKNEGGMQASYDYILSIDADERLSDELAKSILAVKSIDNPSVAYSFNRLNHIGAQPIKVCGWYPDISTRLYHRHYAKWTARAVHEVLEVNGTTEWLVGDLLHYSFADYASIREKSNRYARLAATVYSSNSKVENMVKLWLNPLLKFMKAYILQQGFTAGYVGLRISYEQARETFVKYYEAVK